MSLTSKSYLMRRTRGATFFTMVVFVMMLVSTALMYYYFQRTRMLEKQLNALKSGEEPGSRESGGLFAFLPWNSDKEDSDDTVNTTVTPPVTEAAAEPAAAPPPAPKPAVDETALPPTGAASTPRPQSAPAGSAEPVSPSDSPYNSLNLEMTPPPKTEPDTLTPEEEDAAETEKRPETAPSEPEEDTEEGEAPTPQSGEVNSMYDVSPPVRVRAPRRD